MKQTIKLSAVFLLVLTLLAAKEKSNQKLKSSEIERPPLLTFCENGYRLVWNTHGNPGSKHGNPGLKWAKKGGKSLPVEVKQGIVDGNPSGYTADFTDMENDEEYFYKLPGQKKVYFTSPKAADQSFSFAAISDHQIWPDETAKGFNFATSEKPDFIVSAGDMLNNGVLKNWCDNFFANVPLLSGIPFAAAEGNNDAGRHLFQSFMGQDEEYSTFVYSNTRFIMLNTNIRYDEKSPQYQWLESVLQNNSSNWTIVVFHIGPYVSHSGNWSNMKARKTIVPLLERNNVNLVLGGHYHFYERTQKINGIYYVTLPCLSAEASRSSSDLDKSSGFYGKAIYERVGCGFFDVTPDAIKMTVKMINGEILDEFTITK